MTQSGVRRLLGALFTCWCVWASVSAAQVKAPSAVVSAAVSTSGDGPATVDVMLDIPPGLHAQSRTPLEANLIRLDVALDDAPAGVLFGEAVYPPGEVKDYPQLGKLSVYEGKVVVRVPLTVDPAKVTGDVTITGKIRFQLCDEAVCFPPKRTPFSVTTTLAALNVKVASATTSPATTRTSVRATDVTAGPAASAGAAQATSEPPSNAASGGTPPGGTPPGGTPPGGTPPGGAPPGGAPPGGTWTGGALPAGPKDWSIWTAFGAAALAGLLFNIMPCVLPVLPLKAMGFYEVAQHRRGQSLLYGLAFSAGVIAVFGVLAVLVLVLHAVSWGSLFSHGWFVWAIVALLLVMAVGLFGVFTVNLPVAAYSFTPRHDTYTGNFLWGGLTAVLATPCTAPLLPGVLLWASAKPTYVGVPAMLMVGVGMSLPYLILSAFPELARRFPRVGPWPELFKQMMGFMILGAVVFFGAGRLVGGPAFFWAVCAVAAVASVYLMARTVQLTKNATPVVVSSIVAVALVGGTFWWSAKINGLLAPAGASTGNATTQWTHYSTDAFNAARAGGGPVLVKFTANWCATCQYIEGTVYRDANVLQALSDACVTLLKADLTDSDAPGNDLLLQLNPAGGIPLTAIYAPGNSQPVLLSSVYDSQTLLDTLKTFQTQTASR